MSQTASLLLVLVVLMFQSNIIQGINFKNNACKRTIDYYWFYASKNCYYNPNVMSNTPSMVVKNGYTLESHKVTTEDGYILTLFRISAKGADENKTKKPVFLEHGITTASSDFVCAGNNSYAFVLHDLGYDVWLGNFRGTPYSREHVTLKDTQREYWNFAVDSLALYDLRASLLLVANYTGHQIIYLGHSQGTTTIFMYCSTYPGECEEILQGIIALSPIVYLNPGLRIQPLLKVDRLLYFVVTNLLGINVVAPKDTPTKQLVQITCRILPFGCKLFVDFSFGHSGQTPEFLMVLYSYFPKAVTTKQLLQYTQIYNSQEFKRFDNGPRGNLKLYGQKRPPLYDLGKINLPTYMFYGLNDSIIIGEGVNRLYRELGSTKKVLRLAFGKNGTVPFNHLDFFFSNYVYEFFHEEIAPVLESQFSAKRLKNDN